MTLNTLTYLAISIFACLIAGKLIKLLKLPNVTAYLLAGILIGPHCLNILPLNVIENFDILSDMALGFIAFSIGAEFKISYLKKIGISPIVIAIFESLTAVIIVDAVLIISGQDIAFSLCLGAIASATAAASTLMIVKQYKASGPVTQALLPVVALDDAVALIAFGLSVSIAKAITSTKHISIISMIKEPIIEIFGALLFGGLLGIIFCLIVKWYTGRGNRLAATIGIVFLCVGISNLLGFSSLLACMALSFVFVNFSPNSEKIFEPVDRTSPPIYMLFFLVSGAELDVTILPKIGIIGVIYVVFRCVGKISGAYIGAKLSHAEPVVQKWLGFTLIPQEGVAIGLSIVAMSVVPAYGSTIRAIILCSTLIYELVGPVISKLVLIKAGEIKSA